MDLINLKQHKVLVQVHLYNNRTPCSNIKIPSAVCDTVLYPGHVSDAPSSLNRDRYYLGLGQGQTVLRGRKEGTNTLE